MDAGQIKVKYTDTGHWLARCDHSTGVIELNRREYPRLSPLFRDYVWCHECVHLLYNVYDEEKCNSIVDRIFIDRAKTERERQERLDFIAKSEGMSTVYGFNPISWGIEKAADLVVQMITENKISAANLQANENSGFNALSDSDQRVAVEIMLDYGFKKAKRNSTRTAQNFFMAKMEPYLSPLSISSYSLLLNRYPWIADYIDKYEKKYGFGFTEVKPADNRDIYIGASVAVVILIVAIYLFVKYKKH